MRSPLTLLLVLFACLLGSARAQDIRITEFLAINVDDIVDEDGDHSPWVEIWNPSTSPVTMSNWRLSNGIAQFTLPVIGLNAGERMIIWASGKTKNTSAAPLHTNFTLPVGGGTVSLLRPDTSVASSLANYPAQQADVSWGRDEWDAAPTPTLVGSYSNPTPGERNNYTGPGVAGKVAFDKTSRAFTGTLAVTLTKVTADPAAVIRYTTTGAVPTATSTAYTVPLNITSTTQLRARVFKTGLLPGETETNCYLLLDATTSTFSSAMPIVVLTNFGAGQPPDTGDQAGFAWVWEPAAPDNRSRFTNAPTLATRIAIDRRGSSTLSNLKYNLNMEARKARDDDDRNVELLGMPAGSDYVMSGPFEFDRSLIHNPFIFALSNAVGRYAPRTRMAEVFMDVNAGPLNAPGGNTNDYYGVYNVMEKIRRDPERVNIHSLNMYDNSTVARTGGFIWKVDRLDSGDGGFSAGGQSMAYYYPKEVELEAPQRDPQEQHLASYINTFNSVLQSATWNNPTTGYAAYLDVPGAVDHHLLNVWPMNVDALRLSGYWHKERGGKMVAGPIWDFDRAMESTDSRDDNPATWIGGGDATPYFTYTWWNRLFLDINFYQKYIDRWQALRRGAFSAANVNALLDTLNAQISNEAVARDVARWGKTKRTNSFPNSPSPSYPGTQAGEVQRIKEWLQVRANFIDTQWVAPVNASLPEGNVASGTPVTLSGPPGATIYYTVNGADPRPSGGGAPSGVLTYTGTPITIDATKRIRARAYNANWAPATGGTNPPLASKWSGLTDVRYSIDTPAAAGNLVVTELNYHPTDPTAAELLVNPVFSAADFEFIELRNLGATPIDLGGAKFALGIDFTFIGDNALTLAPGAYVVVAANPSAYVARYGSGVTAVGPFAGDLSNAGEQLIIKTPGNDTILDFTYDDWFAPTDGGGRTLAIYDPYAAAGAFSMAGNWRASAATNGSPGATEPNLAPTVNPGASVSGVLTGIALTPTVTDDSQPNPPKAVTYSWSKLLGPGTATFTPGNTANTNVSFSLPGVYTLRLTANDSALSSTGDVIVFAKDTPEAWLSRHPGIGTLEDDFDGDGRTNYAEFGLVLDPSVPDFATSPVIGSESGRLTLTYKRIKPPSTTLYSIEVAETTNAFRAPNPGELSEQIFPGDGLTETVKIIDSVTTTAQPERYLRLRIGPVP